MTHKPIARRLRRSFAAAGIVIALALPAAALADEPAPDPGSSAIAAQAPSAAPTEPAPSGPGPTLAAPGDPGDGQGEVVIDGPFVTPTPEGSVLDAVSEPRLTPPPTDAGVRTGSPAAASARGLLLTSVAGAVALALALCAISGREARPATTSRGQSSSCVPGQTNDTGPSYSALTEATVSSGSNPIWMCVSSTRATPVDAARRPTAGPSRWSTSAGTGPGPKETSVSSVSPSAISARRSSARPQSPE